MHAVGEQAVVPTSISIRFDFFEKRAGGRVHRRAKGGCFFERAMCVLSSRVRFKELKKPRENPVTCDELFLFSLFSLPFEREILLVRKDCAVRSRVGGGRSGELG